ncbi:MAG: AzlD domain-containing protein [Actinomycetia bacterium]|nr:AzlD domain-containing protein [Actinomycetes bacterium]
MSFTIQMVVVAIGTYLMRLSVIVAAAGRRIPPRLESTLRLIPAAVLPALVANAVLFDGGELRPFGPWYVAMAIAVGVAVWTRSVGWTLTVGMVAVWGLTAIW